MAFVILLYPIAIQAQSTGHIQVKSPLGVKIYLDGDFKGVSTEELGGFIIQNVQYLLLPFTLSASLFSQVANRVVVSEVYGGEKQRIRA